MKNLLKVNCMPLTNIESQQVNGGSIKLKTPAWYDISFIAGAIVQGFVVFSSQGGRNAGLCVR